MFNFYSNIIDYLDGNLSAIDMKAFELTLSNDEVLKQILENHACYSAIADEIINDDISQMIIKAHIVCQ